MDTLILQLALHNVYNTMLEYFFRTSNQFDFYRPTWNELLSKGWKKKEKKTYKPSKKLFIYKIHIAEHMLFKIRIIKIIFPINGYRNSKLWFPDAWLDESSRYFTLQNAKQIWEKNLQILME